jgi:hypothetical protein
MTRSPSRNAGPRRPTAACVALWALIAVFVSSVSATQVAPRGQDADRRVILWGRLSLVLPKSCTAVVLASSPDHWVGRIDCDTQQIRIEYFGGLVGRPQGSGSGVWSKTEYLSGGRLDVQLLRNRTQFELTAAFGLAGFYATVKTEAEASKVLEWLRSLRLGEPCPKCERARDLR